MRASNGELLEGRWSAGAVPAVRWRTRRRPSEKTEIDELAPERLGHRRKVARGASEIAWRVRMGKIAPALERPARPGLDRDHDGFEHEVAPADAVLARERPDREEPLAAGHLPLHHPIKGAAPHQSLRALRHHAGGVGLLVGAAQAPVMRRVLLDPLLEVAD